MNIWVHVVIFWYFLFLDNDFFLQLCFSSNSCHNVINLGIWECVCLWDCWNEGVKTNFLGTGVDYFVHFFQCMSFCWCKILDSFSIFRNKVVLACCVDYAFVLSLLMKDRHRFSLVLTLTVLTLIWHLKNHQSL